MAAAVKRSAPEAPEILSMKKQKAPDCSEKLAGVCLGSDEIDNMVQCDECGKWACWDCSCDAAGWKDGYCESCDSQRCCVKIEDCKRCNAGHCAKCMEKCCPADGGVDCDLGGTIDCTGVMEYRCSRCKKGACQACYETEDWYEHFCELCQKVYCCETVESCDGCERQRCDACGKACCGDDGDSSSSPNEKDDE